MNRLNKLLNYGICFSLSLFLYLSYAQYLVTKKLGFRIEQIRQEKANSQKMISIAEKIGRCKNREVEFISLEEYLDYKTNDFNWENHFGYEKEYNELLYYQYKLSKFTNHNMTILDKYEVYQDKITKELHLGWLDDVRIVAEFNQLYINDIPIKQSQNNKYVIPNNQKIIFKMEKYTLNSSKIKIDTLITLKTINYAI